MFKSIKEVKQRMSEFTTQVSKIPFVYVVLPFISKSQDAQQLKPSN